MKAIDIRKKTITELKDELRELLREQFNLRMRKGFDQALRSHNFKNVRRDIARVKTILREKVNET